MQVLRARRVEQLSGYRPPGNDSSNLNCSDQFLCGRTSSDCSIARKAREKARLQLPIGHSSVRRSGSAPSCLRRAAGKLKNGENESNYRENSLLSGLFKFRQNRRSKKSTSDLTTVQTTDRPFDGHRFVFSGGFRAGS